jgi:hypothetical protein
MPVVGILRSTPAAPFTALVAALRHGLGEAVHQGASGNHTKKPHCLAGVVGLEPANPSASYLIGIA